MQLYTCRSPMALLVVLAIGALANAASLGKAISKRSVWKESASELENAVFTLRGQQTDIPCFLSETTILEAESHGKCIWRDRHNHVISNSRFGLTETGNLVIEDAQPEDVGKYTCSHQRGEVETTYTHHLLVFTLPNYSIETTMVYKVVSCDDPVQDTKMHELRLQLCADDEKTCAYDVTKTCHIRSEHNEDAEEIAHETWINVEVKTASSFKPPECDEHCMKDAILENLEHNYTPVEAVQERELTKTNENIEYEPKLTTKSEIHKCSDGYKPHDSIVCLPCNPGSFSKGGDVTCTLCPKGSYQNKYASNQCFPCANGTTPDVGAHHKGDCQDPDVTVVKVEVKKNKVAIFAGVSAIPIAVILFAVVYFLRHKTGKQPTPEMDRQLAERQALAGDAPLLFEHDVIDLISQVKLREQSDFDAAPFNVLDHMTIGQFKALSPQQRQLFKQDGLHIPSVSRLDQLSSRRLNAGHSYGSVHGSLGGQSRRPSRHGSRATMKNISPSQQAMYQAIPGSSHHSAMNALNGDYHVPRGSVASQSAHRKMSLKAPLKRLSSNCSSGTTISGYNSVSRSHMSHGAAPPRVAAPTTSQRPGSDAIYSTVVTTNQFAGSNGGSQEGIYMSMTGSRK